MVQLVWTTPALHDLAAVRAFAGQDNPGAAGRQVALVVAAALGLINFPNAGRPGRRTGTRELVVGRTPYIVAYRVRGDTVELLRVLHGRQRWPNM